MRLLFMSLMCLLPSLTFAQESEAETQGKIVIGGSFNFNTQSSENVKTSSFSFAPSIAYEKGHWMYGAYASYSRLNTDIDFYGTYRSSVLGGGLFARYTFTPDSKFSFYLQPYAQYSYAENFNTSSENPSSGNFQQLEFGLSPGIRYDITPRVRILARLGGINYGRTFHSNDIRIPNGSNFNIDCKLNGSNFGVEMRF